MSLFELQTTTIEFGVPSTPYGTYTFMETLGLELCPRDENGGHA
jgi:hypothetical protein